MSLDYGTHAPSTTKTHDHLYTMLLGVVCFFLALGIAWTVFMMPALQLPRAVALMVVAEEGLLLAVCLVVMLIRLIFPARRRWPKLGLNIILLPFIPFGTALGVYGLWKVDKKLRRASA